MNVKNPTDPTNGNPHNPEPGTVWAWHKEVYKLMGPDDEEEDVFINPNNHENWASGTLANLDSEEEWAFERGAQTGKLYLKASEGFIPGETNVRVRVRDRSVKVQDSDNLTLKNLQFFAGSLDLTDCDYLTIEDSTFSFSSDIGLKSRKNSHSGNYHRLTNSIFEHINGATPWTTIGQHAKIENVLIQNNDWFNLSAWYTTAKPMGGVELPEGRDGGFYRTVTSRLDTGGSNHPDIRDESWYAPEWRYVTVRDSWTAGIWPGRGSLVEYARFENLYDHIDGSGIQRNYFATTGSTTRYCWMINLPVLNAIRFDSYKAGNFGEVHHIVSVGNRTNLRLKGDYHETYHVTSYDTGNKGIYNYTDRYSGFSDEPEHLVRLSVPGNANSRFLNSTAQEVILANSPDFWPSLEYVEGRDEYDPTKFEEGYFPGLITAIENNPNYLLRHSGIWYGRTMDSDRVTPSDLTYPDFIRPWSNPQAEMENPWQKTLSFSGGAIVDYYGFNPYAGQFDEVNDHAFGVQSYDFRPKKGSSLIDTGVIVPGLNDGLADGFVAHPDWTDHEGNPRDFNHDETFTGQHRPFVGKSPDIGAYEYGDSVYWIPGFRYATPSVPIPNDQATAVPLEYGLAFNWPYKRDYTGTRAEVIVNGPDGWSHTATLTYPTNVLLDASGSLLSFRPDSPYTWTVRVFDQADITGVSGDTWSFTTTDRIHPINDRSVDISADEEDIGQIEVYPQQREVLEVSSSHVTFLRFDLPETISDTDRLQLNLVPVSVTTLEQGIGLYVYNNPDWTETHDDRFSYALADHGKHGDERIERTDTNIGTADHRLGKRIHTFRELTAGKAIHLDLSDVALSDMKNSHGDFSLALKAIGNNDAASFYSKETLLKGETTSTEPVDGFVKWYAEDNQKKPSITFRNSNLENVVAANGAGHKVTVKGGNGDGFYDTGQQVSIRAELPDGLQFVSWVGELDVLALVADVNAAITMVTIPAVDLSLRASYTYGGSGEKTVVSWTGGGADADVANANNWSNGKDPSQAPGDNNGNDWESTDLGVIALLDEGDGKHVLDNPPFTWHVGGLLLKGDTEFNADRPQFNAGSQFTLEDNTVLNAYDLILNGSTTPDLGGTSLQVRDNARVEIPRQLILKYGSTVHQQGGEVKVTNEREVNGQRLWGVFDLRDGSVYSIASGRLEINVNADKIKLRDSDDSTQGYIDFNDGSSGEIYFEFLSHEEIQAYVESGGIRINGNKVTSSFDSRFTYNTAAKVLRLQNTRVPTITGAMTQGETINADTTGILDTKGGVVAPEKFSYQWFRADDAIVEATAPTYMLAPEDANQRISLTVHFLDSNGTKEILTSTETEPVQNINDDPGGSLRLNSYFPPVGRTLTANITGITDLDGLPGDPDSFRYQWYRDDSPIATATASSYTLGDDDLGASISLSVSYTDAGLNMESLTSRATYAVHKRPEDPNGTGFVPVLRDLHHAEGAFRFEFESQTGSHYQVEWTDDMKEWGAAKSYDGTGTTILFEDEVDQLFPEMYYRVRVVVD